MPVIVHLFDYKVVVHMKSLLAVFICIFLITNDVKCFLMLSGHLRILFGEMSIQVLRPFTNGVTCLFIVEDLLAVNQPQTKHCFLKEAFMSFTLPQTIPFPM